MNPERWKRLMVALGFPECPDVYAALAAAYAEPGRYYHGAPHLDDCLDQLDRVAEQARSAPEVEVALWFHDAVYRMRRPGNEQKSAEWARDFLEQNGADADRCDRVYGHIMATTHTGDRPAGDTALVVDIDLSVLGRAAEQYTLFEENVRKEYRWVPRMIFRTKRKAVLQSFLDRPTIYATEFFRARYEDQARRNLTSAIAALS